jgi:beta-glucosidase
VGQHTGTRIRTGDGASPDITALSLVDKVRLLTGRSSWETHPLPGIGLRSIVVSDGPVGVRGSTSGPADWALLLPAPSAIAATWDVAAAAAVGRLMAAEARRKGVDVVLAPVVNLQRTPVAGRHFEYFSEDPVLTGTMAVALVDAAQALGVGVCLKHFVANDSETERTTYLAQVDERTLREVYLAPFERVVREARPWMVMAAYNRVSAGGVDAPATEHHYLLSAVLKGEWAYDGVVVSDWLATSSTAESALAGLDLVMPGPGGPWEHHLLAAVESGVVPEELIDDKVVRIVRLAERVGALTTPDSPAAPTAPQLSDAGARDLLTRLAAQGSVLLRNEDTGAGAFLPLDRTRLTSVALIGAAATDPLVQGGGSGLITPPHVVTPLEGLRKALPPNVRLRTHAGVPVTQLAPDLDPARMSDPSTGLPGVSVEVLDRAGHTLRTEHLDTWTGRYVVDDAPAAGTVRVRTRVRLDEPGTHRLAVGTVGEHHVTVDGVTVDAGGTRVGSEVILDSSVNEPPDVPAEVVVVAPRLVTVSADLQVIDGEGYGRFARGALRHELPAPPIADALSAAAQVAAEADVAVVLVGTTIEVESEGRDRTSLALPGAQDELVRRVVAANPRTVVVVNAGAPVLLPWLDDPAPHGPAAVLWWWLPGQEAGHALAAVLLGSLEPAGRLPWTLPAREEDVPVAHARPVDGVLGYREGVDIGYRAWQRSGRRPARPFGFGIGWGEWRYDRLEVSGSAAHDDLRVTVDVTNLGPRSASEVIQVYVSEPVDDGHPRVRRLAGSGRVGAGPGTSTTASIRVPRRALERWQPGHGWCPIGPAIQIEVGRDSTDVRLDTTLDARAHTSLEKEMHEGVSATPAGCLIIADVDRKRTS